MDRGAWRAAVHRIAKSRLRLSHEHSEAGSRRLRPSSRVQGPSAWGRPPHLSPRAQGWWPALLVWHPWGALTRLEVPSRAFLMLGLAEGRLGREVKCPLCPRVPIQPLLFSLLQVLPIWQSQAVPIPVGSPAGRRLSLPGPQPLPVRLWGRWGRPRYALCISVPAPLHCPSPPVFHGVGPSSRLPLCFLLQPPLGFLLIPVYSLFYKSL